MQDVIKDAMRQRVAKILPETMTKTLESYKSFVGSEKTESAKEFSDHHAACKVAITHLELLLKLAHLLDIPEGKESDNENNRLTKILADAQAELRAYRDRQSDG